MMPGVSMGGHAVSKLIQLIQLMQKTGCMQLIQKTG